MKLRGWLRRWAPWMGVCAIVLFMVAGGAMVAAQQQEEYRASSFDAYLEEVAAQRATQPETEEPTVDEPDTQTPSPVQPEGAQIVYAAPSGKRYHFDSACPGENGREITWDEVAARGLTPCKKCAGG